MRIVVILVLCSRSRYILLSDQWNMKLLIFLIFLFTGDCRDCDSNGNIALVIVFQSNKALYIFATDLWEIYYINAWWLTLLFPGNYCYRSDPRLEIVWWKAWSPPRTCCRLPAAGWCLGPVSWVLRHTTTWVIHVLLLVSPVLHLIHVFLKNIFPIFVFLFLLRYKVYISGISGVSESALTRLETL